MLNVNKFISDYITARPVSLFAQDIEANKVRLSEEIQGKKVLVIGGAGTIGSSYIRAILPFRPSELVVVDISENGLTELTRDLRSTYGTIVQRFIVLIPSTMQTLSLKRYLGSLGDLISWPISRPTNM